jgi:flagellar biosynthetic protein FliR
MFLLGLLAVDGHHLLIRALAHSFECAPVGRSGYDPSFAETATTMVSDLFAAGITFAAPVLVLLVLSSILIGLVARTMPQANVLEIGFSLRILVGLGAMLLFAPLIAPACGHLYGLLDDGLERVLALWEG